MVVTFLSLVILAGLQSRIYAQENAQCTSGNVSKFRFSVTSRRNETGHSLVGVRILNYMKHESSVDVTSDLKVDVEHGTSWCNDSEAISTTVWAEAPPVRLRRQDYELFSDLGYYKLHTKPQTWEQAKLTCMKEGAHLLILNSEGEAGVVKHLFARKPNIQGETWKDWIYVGFSDRAVEGQYTTVLGQPLSSSGYTKWHSGQPDNTPVGTEPDQDCGGMHIGGSLQDLPCLGKAAFICEQQL